MVQQYASQNLYMGLVFFKEEWTVERGYTEKSSLLLVSVNGLFPYLTINYHMGKF